ncbi:MAG: serine protease [Bacteriovoracaceae bacterium]
MKYILLLFSVALSSQAHAAVEVVYGEDNRVDVYESTNSVFVELAKSTAAMIPNDNVKDLGNGEYAITGKSLQGRGMCATERFSYQMSAANCSGFLVGDNLLVTAGHCIKGQSDCNSSRWVFDYKVENDSQFDVSVAAENVYGCKKVISRSLDMWSKDDYALIELDRPAKNKVALKYRKSGNVSPGDNLVVIGHPSGLPTKIADGAKVRELHKNYFSANLDTYGGNSGSPVFNVDTGEVEGILVRGEKDYVYDRDQRCNVTNYLGDDEGRGEDVTYIGNIAELR